MLLQRRPVSSCCGRATRAITSHHHGTAHRPAERALGRAVCNSAPTDVFALDFDGVLIDSEPEVTASAYVAAEIRWPQVFSAERCSPERKAELMAAMRIVRPVLVRGHESMVMLRMLHEDITCGPRILKHWPQAMHEALASWKEDEQPLVELFESTRNEWMTQRTESWMQLQQPYPGVMDALNEGGAPFYIVSSKAAKRVSALAQSVMGLDLPPDSPRLFGSLLPPEEMKAETLELIMRRPMCSSPSTTLHFVDDRLDTLTAIMKHPDLKRWKLYLADWGYNTAEERAAAAALPGVKVINLPQFCELLRFGLVMDVHDGCEPTPEEVQAGVMSD